MAQTGKSPDDAPVFTDEIEVLKPHFGIDDVPKPAELALYAWQHTLVDVSPFVLPLVVAKAVGYGEVEAAAMISTCLALMGFFTFVNATWGHRLPSVMGPSATMTGAMAAVGASFGAAAMWAAACFGGLIQTLLGASGALGFLRRFLPPAVCGLIVLTIGVSLARVAAGWVLAVPDNRMAALVVATALSILGLTVVGHRFGLGLLARGAILFSLIGVGLVIGGLAGATRFEPVAQAAWFGLPRLFPFESPGEWNLIGAAVAALLIAYLGVIAESIGDYAGTCAVSGVTYRVSHMRRGITVEGIASTLAPIFGAIPLTTYSQNTGVIATTRVASRRVVQVAALILMAYGLSPKVGALLVVIPRPILGVVFLVVCGMIAVAGLRLLFAGEKDEAWTLTTALTLSAALALPVAAAGSAWLKDQSDLVRLFMTNGVVIATVLGILLNFILRKALRS